MKTYKILLIIGVFITALYSCENEIEFNSKSSNPYMVVNSILNPDSLIKVQLTKSRFFLENDSAFETIDNATVKLFVNDKYFETLDKTSRDGLYMGTYKAVVGDIVKILVTSAEFGEVNGETSINKPITILKIDTTSTITQIYPMVNYISNDDPTQYGYTLDTIGVNYTYNLKITANIKDSSNFKNYYRLKVKYRSYLDDGRIEENDIYFDSKDNVFGSTGEDEIFGNSNASYYYHEFSDELFDGKNYNLQFNTNFNKSVYFKEKPTSNYNPDLGIAKLVKQEIVVEIQSLSESYYLYLHSRGAQMNYVEFFSEPVQIQSNINNGIGILGSYTTKRAVIEIPLTWGFSYYYGYNEW